MHRDWRRAGRVDGSGHCCPNPRECAQTWHVERADFDKLLFDNAANKGAICCDETKVVDVQLCDAPPHRIRLKTAVGQTTAIEARVIIDATGQQSLLANRLQLKKNDPKLRKAAIWGHFAGGRRSSYRNGTVTTILHTEAKRAWFWYIPITGDRVSVGLVSDSDYLLRDRADSEKVFCEHARTVKKVGRTPTWGVE